MSMSMKFSDFRYVKENSVIFTMSKRIIPRWLINCNTSNPYFEAAKYIYIYILKNRSKTSLHGLSLTKKIHLKLECFQIGLGPNQIELKTKL